jgi:hypothetical protein
MVDGLDADVGITGGGEEFEGDAGGHSGILEIALLPIERP